MLTKLLIGNFQAHPIAPEAAAWCNVERIQGLGGMPPPRQETFDRPRRHGLVNRTQFFPGRVIDVAGRLLSNQNAGGSDLDIVQALEQLKGQIALTGDEDVKLTFRLAGREEDEFVMARLHGGFDAEFEPRRHAVLMWGVQLLAADPRMYSDVLKSAVYDPTLAGSGFGADVTTGGGADLVGGISFGTPVSGTLNVQNQGNFPTPVELTVTGPSTNPRIVNVTRGLSIWTTGLAMVNGDVLVVDTGLRTITLNGLSRPDLLDVAQTVWWEAGAGDNQTQLVGTGHVTGQTSLTARWRDARV